VSARLAFVFVLIASLAYLLLWLNDRLHRDRFIAGFTKEEWEQIELQRQEMMTRMGEDNPFLVSGTAICLPGGKILTSRADH